MLKRNLIANYLGQGWVAVMGLAFIPIYIKYLGIEAYGLIGLFAVLQAWLVLLDMGMTPALGREMARFTGGSHTAQSIRDLLRSIEVVALGMSIAIGVGIWLASDWLASDWLKAEKLSTQTVSHAFTVMGVVTALRFAEGVYRSSILGLQRQVLFNVVNSAMATLRSVGAVAVLIWVSPTIEAFFRSFIIIKNSKRMWASGLIGNKIIILFRMPPAPCAVCIFKHRLMPSRSWCDAVKVPFLTSPWTSGLEARLTDIGKRTTYQQKTATSSIFLSDLRMGL